jgi:hypothetical protein
MRQRLIETSGGNHPVRLSLINQVASACLWRMDIGRDGEG